MTAPEIDAPALERWLKTGEAVLVDVREPVEHAARRIAGAKLVPLGRVAGARLPDLAGRKLVIHCQKGGRGNAACEKLLRENPSLEVYNLAGGIEAWGRAGLPVQDGRKGLPLDRQTQLTIGIGLLLAAALAFWVHPGFLLLVAFFGAGLTFAGGTGHCGMARLLAAMPWNRPA
jgi:rhodanese-related sulfurtransferase